MYYDEAGCGTSARGSARSGIGGANYVYIPVGDYSTSELGECITLDTLFRASFND